jgi:hypothetical protein
MSCINTTRNNRFSLAAAPFRGLGCRGSAIVLVVSVAAVVTLLIMTWVMLSVRRYHAVVEKRDGLNARYAAESVVSKALYERMINPQNNRDSSGTLIVQRDSTGLKPSLSDSTRKSGISDSAVSADSLTDYVDSVHHSSGAASLAEEGTFLRVKAEGHCAKAHCVIDAQFGLGMPPPFRYALVLTEQNRQLEIRSGRIIGDVHLANKPSGPIQGKIETPVEANLPKIAEDKLAKECRKLEAMLTLPDSSETGLQGAQVFYESAPPPLKEGQTLYVNGNILIENRSKRPFTVKGPGAIVAAGDIQISGPTVMDNVTIAALGNVQCFDDARLQKVTVFSKSLIGFADDVRVSGNFYACEKLVCAGRSTVEMPSFAYVKGTLPPKANPERDFGGIEITQQSRFSGTAFCLDGKTISSIERDDRFTGLFYTHGQNVIQGTVFGCVAAALLREAVILRGNMEQQKNILAGGTINRKILPKNFVVPAVFGQPGSRYSLISWSETMPRDSAVEPAHE